jgi:hypothetical protein
LKKFLPIFLAFIICVGSTIFQVEKASANPLVVAVPAGIEIGAGVYAGGALILAGLAAAYGADTYSDQIKTHATNVWNSANDTTKAMFIESYKTAIAANKKTMVLSQEFYDLIHQSVAGSVSTINDGIQFGAIYNVVTNGLTTVYTIPTSRRTSWSIKFYRTTHTNLVNTLSTFTLTQDPAYPTYYTIKELNDDVRIYNGNIGSGLEAVFAFWSGTVSAKWKEMQFFDLSYNGPVIDTGVLDQKIDDAFGWTDTGAKTIRIPTVGEFNPTTVIGGVSTPVTWDDVAQTWKNPSGTAVPTVDVNVGTPTLALEGGNVIATDSTGTKVNVIDESVPEPDLPIESPNDKIRWNKLAPLISTMKTVFPFSIPWDFYDYFSRFNVTPETPIYNIKADKTIILGGKSIPINFDWQIDFSIFDVVARIIRWGMVICFDIYMITALRKYTPD